MSPTLNPHILVFIMDIRCLQNTLTKFLRVHYNGHSKDPSHSYMKKIASMVFYALKNIHKMWVTSFFAYHHFFQGCYYVMTLMKHAWSFALEWKTMSYITSLLALYFKRWNQTPPYLQSTHATNCTWMWIFIMCAQKIKALIVLQRVVSYPLLTHHQKQLSLLEIQRVWSNESSNWASISLCFGRWPIWLQNLGE
jgi:hypothetical protein